MLPWRQYFLLAQYILFRYTNLPRFQPAKVMSIVLLIIEFHCVCNCRTSEYKSNLILQFLINVYLRFLLLIPLNDFDWTNRRISFPISVNFLSFKIRYGWNKHFKEIILSFEFFNQCRQVLLFNISHLFLAQWAESFWEISLKFLNGKIHGYTYGISILIP